MRLDLIVDLIVLRSGRLGAARTHTSQGRINHKKERHANTHSIFAEGQGGETRTAKRGWGHMRS